MMRFALAALFVAALSTTASATEYMWYEVIDGDPVTIISQGPGELLCFDIGMESSPITVRIGMYMTDDGDGLWTYGYDLNTSAAMVGSNVDPNPSGLYTSQGSSAGTSPLIHSFAFTTDYPPILGADPASAPLMSVFDITISGPGVIEGEFCTGGPQGDDGRYWGAYYYDAYVGPHHMPTGTLEMEIGHYWGYEFGPVIEVLATPEPASLALLAIGAVALLRRR